MAKPQELPSKITMLSNCRAGGMHREQGTTLTIGVNSDKSVTEADAVTLLKLGRAEPAAGKKAE